MAGSEEKTIGFLKQQGMYHGDVDMAELCDTFLKEMSKGLAGESSSLEMIPTYIELNARLPKCMPVLVLDAGGTNFRGAVIHFAEHGRAVSTKFRKHPMPGVGHEVSSKEFFDTLAGYVRDIADTSSSIGFCFSYPCEISPNKDGRLIHFSKEIKAPEVVGQMIGDRLNEAFVRCGTEPKRIIILNDTVTTLLAGMSDPDAVHYDEFVGFILGTGTNTCYIDKNTNITKIPKLDAAKSQIINVESGGFAGVKQGKIDFNFDMQTKNPGVYTFEKMISGAYLGPLCLEAIRAAVRAAVFSSMLAEPLKKIGSLTTVNISEYLDEPVARSHPIGEALADASNYDKAAMFTLIQAIVMRAAKLTAVNLSAAILKSEKGANSKRPVCIVAEGTTFHNLPGLKENTEKYLDEFLVGQKKRYYEIVEVENATLVGAAIAGLTN